MSLQLLGRAEAAMIRALATVWQLLSFLAQPMLPRNRSHFFDKILFDAQTAVGSESLRTIIKVLADGAHKRQGNHDMALGWQFGQFIVGAVGANSALHRYELNEAGDWLAWSLTEAIEEGPEQHLMLGRLEAFLHPLTSSWQPFAGIFIGWFCDFYYYARARAAMPEIAKSIFPLALGTVQMMWDGRITE